MFPTARVGVRPSLAPIVIVLAALLLAGLLALLSWRNYRHEERLRERLLHQQGEILIRSFEAGARTGMMMRWRNDALKTLVDETVRETEVAYIAIVDRQGAVVAAGGSWAAGMTLPLAAVLTAEEPQIRSTRDATGRPVYEMARRYLPQRGGRRAAMRHHDRMMADEDGRDMGAPPEQAIFVGLYSGEFEQARRDSLHQSLLLGGLLLLVGSAGFYLLFLSQRNRVAGSTLETMELYTASLIEGMPAGLLSLDPQGQVLAVNGQALEMFEATREALLGRNLGELAGGRSLHQLLQEEGQFIERASAWHLPQGKELPLRVSASQLKNRSGAILGTVLILRDMRELRAMEEQLERSRRHSALGVMATGVAHEIRNPLGTLRGFAQYFQRSSGDTQAREYAGLMISEVDRLNRVISALLQFARPREAEPVWLETAKLCERLFALTSAEAEAHGVALRVETDQAPDRIRGDFDLLLQMLLNLLQNAIEATPAGGQVDLRIRGRDDMLELRVRDSGCGIDPEARQMIFDPFYTTRKSGTGLGLAIVSQIVEQHRGEIGVESVPGRGTEFLVRLPQQDAE